MVDSGHSEDRSSSTDEKKEEEGEEEILFVESQNKYWIKIFGDDI